MILAVAAAGIELVSMVPYLVGIGLMTAAELNAAGMSGTLAACCVAMVLPAIVLVAARIFAHDRVDPVLQRLNAWMNKNGSEALSWFVGIAGTYLALNAASILSVT